MVLTYQEAVEAAKVRAKTTREFWAGSHFDVPHNAVDQFTDGIIAAVLEAVGYADLLVEIERLTGEAQDALWERTRALNERDALVAKVARAKALARYWDAMTGDDINNFYDASYASGILRGYHDAARDLYNVLPLPLPPAAEAS